MKAKKYLTIILFSGMILALVFSPSLSAQEKAEEKKAQEAKPVIIPPQVKSVLEMGKETWQSRQDIPFSITHLFYLPAREYLHSIFIFNVKNSDLGFTPLLPVSPIPEKKQEKEKEETPPPEPESPPTKLQARCHVFLQFNRLENNTPGELVKEIYIPVNLLVEGSEYEPEKEDFYSTGYILLPGNYLLSMAIASFNLERIGTQYFVFSLPDPLSFTTELETTPIFLVRRMKEMPGPETKINVHKGYFIYSYLQIDPNLDHIFSVGENLDVFYYIFGSKPNEEGKHNISVNYEVLEGDKPVIRFSPQTYVSPIVSQPLPLIKTVLVKSETQGERKERRNLEAGIYTLSIKIQDQVTGNSATKTVEFEVK
jgi:hypothetical protein